jgi:hypothetical protein
MDNPKLERNAIKTETDKTSLYANLGCGAELTQMQVWNQVQKQRQW